MNILVFYGQRCATFYDKGAKVYNRSKIFEHLTDLDKKNPQSQIGAHAGSSQILTQERLVFNLNAYSFFETVSFDLGRRASCAYHHPPALDPSLATCHLPISKERNDKGHPPQEGSTGGRELNRKATLDWWFRVDSLPRQALLTPFAHSRLISTQRTWIEQSYRLYGLNETLWLEHNDDDRTSIQGPILTSSAGVPGHDIMASLCLRA
ncbi:uncharacterized protein NECHADRAFT_78364 [Fusarium vanettenii 77-13-4]|uniref:Uncharacterized protein n=1 Tax=Fusarium vanettenii (strain ATCC MYA-4622 / CBS 123669 / FGSC 9596 / NRRL 45880 / 77-13-4) TaxID=660122 RepID=C7ZFL5_FUSV7|nr:uncharacterized protein NECHADRAFT_78364 [Fusarium vanettenii 77-13-4]EEU37172.1 predicted protein [Fusarium vanettenii 77-13-4]